MPLTTADHDTYLMRLAAAQGADDYAAIDRELRARPDALDPSVMGLIKLGEEKSGGMVFASFGRMVRNPQEILDELQQEGVDPLAVMVDPNRMQNEIMQPVLRLMMRVQRQNRMGPTQDVGLSVLMRDEEFEMAMRATEADMSMRRNFVGSPIYQEFVTLLTTATTAEELAQALELIREALAPEYDRGEGEGYLPAPVANQLTRVEMETLQGFAIERQWDIGFAKAFRVERQLGYADCVAMEAQFNEGPEGQQAVFERLENLLAERDGREPDRRNLPPVPGLPRPPRM
jgi:hypothetical protein